MPENSERDHILFNEIKHGKQNAFSELFNKYYNDLCEYSCTISGNKFCAEEVVSDVFANIWIKRKKIKIIKSVKAYLYKSTRNTTISYLRKNKYSFDELNETFTNINGQDFSPESNLRKEELKKQIDHLLSVIPKKSREIFILNRFNEFKYRDIAGLLDVSIKTVEKHMSKALRILRDNYFHKNKKN